MGRQTSITLICPGATQNISVVMNVYVQRIIELTRKVPHRAVRMVAGGKREEAKRSAYRTLEFEG